MLEIKENSVKNSYIGESSIFVSENDSNHKRLYLSISPTANCQLFTIGNIKCLLPDFQQKTKEDFLIILGYILKNVIFKHMLLIDVNIVFVDRFKEVISEFYRKKPIVTKYKNSNGTDMAIILTDLNISKIVDFYQKKDEKLR